MTEKTEEIDPHHQLSQLSPPTHSLVSLSCFTLLPHSPVSLTQLTLPFHNPGSHFSTHSDITQCLIWTWEAHTVACPSTGMSLDFMVLHMEGFGTRVGTCLVFDQTVQLSNYLCRHGLRSGTDNVMPSPELLIEKIYC